VLADVVATLGRESKVDLAKVSQDVQLARVTVSRRSALHKTLRELDLTNRFNVTLARIQRAGVELEPKADFELKFGDVVFAVGPAEGNKRVEQELGNAQQDVDSPKLIP